MKECVSSRNVKYYVLVIKNSLYESDNYVDKFSIAGFTHFSKYYTQSCRYKYLSKEEAEKDIAFYLAFIKNGSKAIPTTPSEVVKKKTVKPRARRKTKTAEDTFAELATKMFETQPQDSATFVTKTITSKTTTKPRKSKKTKTDES